MKSKDKLKRKYSAPPFENQKQEYPGVESKMVPKADHGEKSYKGYGRFKNKVVLITGGDSGIGKAIAIAFAREGAHVVINYLSEMEEEDALDTKKWIEEAGTKALLLRGDITEWKFCKSLIAECIKKFKKLDVLINNAAFHKGRKRISNISLKEWDLTFDTNVKALFQICKAADPFLKAGSCIVNTSSITAYEPSDQLLAYSASKAAVQNFTANLSKQYLDQNRGIRVNAVAPGITWTPLITSTKIGYKQSGADTPMERPAQPVEIAPAYLFLASVEASYISGITLVVAGGRTAF